MSTFEIVTTYYDRKIRREVRHVHGILEAADVDEAHAEGVRLYGDAGAKLLGQPPSDFYQRRAISVKRTTIKQTGTWTCGICGKQEPAAVGGDATITCAACFPAERERVEAARAARQARETAERAARPTPEPRPTRRCSRCGREAFSLMSSSSGPVCPDCYDAASE